MKSSIVLLVATTVLTLRPAVLSAQSVEPCLPQFAAAALMANLQDLALTTAELRLLDGAENPKLRRLLEQRLASAAVEARHHIDQGPVITARRLPSLASAPERALQYIREHPLEKAPLEEEHAREAKLPGMEWRNIATPRENLEHVSAWISRQPWAAGTEGSSN